MRINFDANASVRPIPEVLECIKAYDGAYLNPSSVHQLGQAAKQIIDQSREEISLLLDLDPEDKIIFTSGATESNNAALQINTNYDTDSIAASSVEHSAVLESLRALPKKLLLLDPALIEDDTYLKNQLDSNLSIFALMAANNETGQIFDVARVNQKVREISARVRIHCDAVQAIGKYQFSFKNSAADTLALSGHKLGALAGIGALIVSKDCHINSWLHGGPQQYSLRAGTENILGIKTLGIAAKAARARLSLQNSQLTQAKGKFQSLFEAYAPRCIVNSFGSKQLPNTLSLRFADISADDLVVALDLNGICISAGSACDSGRPNASHVLLAHGLSKKQAKETIRISFEPQISTKEIETGLEIFKAVLDRAITLKEAA